MKNSSPLRLMRLLVEVTPAPESEEANERRPSHQRVFGHVLTSEISDNFIHLFSQNHILEGKKVEIRYRGKNQPLFQGTVTSCSKVAPGQVLLESPFPYRLSLRKSSE